MSDSRTLVAEERSRELRPLGRARPWVDVAIVSALLLVAALPHGGVFYGLSGYRAALGGVVLGVVTALACAHWRIGARISVLALAAAYLVGAGPLALPELSLWGFVPTPVGLREAVVGAVTSWKDLLTIEVPVFPGSTTTLMPYLAGVVCSFVAITITKRSRRPVWALAPVTALVVSGVFWGSQTAPMAVVVGFAAGLLSWWWAIRALRAERRSEFGSIVRLAVPTEVGRSKGRTEAALLVAFAVVTALASPLLIPPDAPRAVLRDLVAISVDVREYSSPVVTYRRWRTTDAATELFTVSGAAGQRVRLATLDTYNGTVFGVSGQNPESSFKKVGSIFTDKPLGPGETVSTMEVAITGYTGHWVIGSGQVRALEYAGPRARDLQTNLFYSPGAETMLSTTALSGGDSYQVTAVDRGEVPESLIRDRRVLQMPMPTDTNVPEAVAVKAQSLTEGASSTFEQVQALQLKLSSQGFYSDGTDGLSRPGHRTDRLEQFLSEDYMIGDDDQFAPAMVLMLRSLGIPSRLVMGFELEGASEGPVSVTGKDVALWVEVPFEGVGWVAFDPTPPEDQTIRTQVPVPRPKPRPQVLQPPVPPEKPADVPPEELSEVDDSRKDQDGLAGWWILVLQVAGGILVVLSPWLLLVAFKALRAMRRRRKGTPEVRSVGAWLELVDRARDLGVRVTVGVPRDRQAEMIDEQVWDEPEQATSGFRHLGARRSDLGALADALDAAVFGPDEVRAEQSERIWEDQRSVLRRMRTSLGWRRRLGAWLSLSTLRSRWTCPEPSSKPRLHPVPSGHPRAQSPGVHRS